MEVEHKYTGGRVLLPVALAYHALPYLTQKTVLSDRERCDIPQLPLIGVETAVGASGELLDRSARPQHDDEEPRRKTTNRTLSRSLTHFKAPLALALSLKSVRQFDTFMRLRL